MSEIHYFLSRDAVQNQVAVLPCGALPHEPGTAWTEPALRPYTFFLLNDGTVIDTMFRGFAFVPMSLRPGYFLHPLFAALCAAADQTDWLQWIDELFRPDVNLPALNACARDAVDVWIGLPYPHLFQTRFGQVNGRDLNFDETDDRVIAVSWWIDQFMLRWQQEKGAYGKLQLRGFLWCREAVLPHEDLHLVKAVNDCVHRHGLLSLWLPNYGSYLVDQWAELGFDISALSSNYRGNTHYQSDWLTNTSMAARVYNNGMQVVFGKGLIFSDNHYLDYWNLGGDDFSGYMRKSFLVFQFPNHTVGDIYHHRFIDYFHLYSFVKGACPKLDYPDIAY